MAAPGGGDEDNGDRPGASAGGGWRPSPAPTVVWFRRGSEVAESGLGDRINGLSEATRVVRWGALHAHRTTAHAGWSGLRGLVVRRVCGVASHGFLGLEHAYGSADGS